MNELPSVAGRMEMSHADFQRACQVALGELQQNTVSCDNSLVHLLCEAIRCSRECCEIAGGSESKVKIDALTKQRDDNQAEIDRLFRVINEAGKFTATLAGKVVSLEARVKEGRDLLQKCLVFDSHLARRDKFMEETK